MGSLKKFQKKEVRFQNNFMHFFPVHKNNDNSSIKRDIFVFVICVLIFMMTGGILIGRILKCRISGCFFCL